VDRHRQGSYGDKLASGQAILLIDVAEIPRDTEGQLQRLAAAA
jgi:hypothetical protein